MFRTPPLIRIYTQPLVLSLSSAPPPTTTSPTITVPGPSRVPALFALPATALCSGFTCWRTPRRTRALPTNFGLVLERVQVGLRIIPRRVRAGLGIDLSVRIRNRDLSRVVNSISISVLAVSFVVR